MLAQRVPGLRTSGWIEDKFVTLSRGSCACTRSTRADYGLPPQTQTTLKRLECLDRLQLFIGLVPDLSMGNEAAMPGLLNSGAHLE